MTDVVLIDAQSVVAQVWRNTSKAAVVADHPALAPESLVETEMAVACGLVHQAGAFVAPPIGKAQLHAYAGAARWARQTIGLVVAGMPIATDTETRAAMLGHWTAAKLDPSYTVPEWKVADGHYIALTNAQVVALGNALHDFQQKCFAKNKEIDAAIDAGTMSTKAEIAAAFASIANTY